MALSRPWYSRGNVPASDTSTTALVAKSILWALKEALLDTLTGGTLGAEGALPGGGAWAVEGSSDSVAAGMDAVDRWGTWNATKIVRASAGVAHSWIVLKSPNAIGPRYLCIDYASASDQNAAFVFSNNAFTGGSITARPTATKEWVALSGQFAEASANVHRIHKAMDANGNFFFHVNRHSTAIFNFTLWGVSVSDTLVGELCPFFSVAHYSTGGIGAGQIASLTCLGRVSDDTANTAGGGLGHVSWGGTAHSSIQSNVLGGGFDTMPVHVGTTAPTGKNGVRGLVPDVVAIGAASVGASEPTTGAQERMVVGNILVPSSVAPAL